MKIYTKTGDNLTTSVISKRVDKDHLIVEVNGTVDELMSSLMISYHHNPLTDIQEIIISVCHNLMDISSSIVTNKCYLAEEKVIEIEELIDLYDAKLEPLKTFILPGNTLASSYLHLSRTICRRLERRIVSLAKIEKVDSIILKYINRLSDLLFVLSRITEEQGK